MRCGTDHGEECFGADLASHRINGARQHLAIGADGKHGWDWDSTFLLAIEEVPLGNDLAVEVTQEIEGNKQLRLKESGRRQRVDRDSHDIKARFCDLVRVIPKVRQLADAKRSPVSTIEDQDDGADGNQVTQPQDLPAGVREFEVRHHVADTRDIRMRRRLVVGERVTRHGPS